MKKLINVIIILLTLSITVCALGACSNLKNEAEPREFTLHELTITLTSDFEESETTENTVQLNSDAYGVKIVRVSFSDITPKEGYTFPTLTELMVISGLVGNIRESDIKDDDGVKVVDLDTDADGKPNRFFTVYESETAYWAIAFTWSEDTDYATARAESMAWAKSVAFAPAQN